MKAIIYLMLLSAFIASCDDHPDSTIVDIDINLTIVNKVGEDMLNPNVSGSIPESDITMFYEIDGKLKTYLSLSNGDPDYPSGFILNPPDGSGTLNDRYYLTIFSNPTPGESLTILKIEGRQDINLVTKVIESKGNTNVVEIWYKGKLVWPVDGNNMFKYVDVVID